MPRRLRIHVPGGFYHVTMRGNHQRAIFAVAGDRHLLNKIVARAIEKFDARLHAYCWMTNHLHLLMQAGTVPLSNPMRQIAAEFARAMQIKLETTGHFFERRYHASLVDADSYLLELVRYIHLNPVRAGTTRDLDSYLWSSHHAYVGARDEPWVTTDFLLRMFGLDRAHAVRAYKAFVNSGEAALWEPPLQSRTKETAIVGGDAFTARVQNTSLQPKKRMELSDLIDEACKRFEVLPEKLATPVRDPYLAQVRAWIALHARERQIASLSAVARALGRDEATLRQSIRTYRREIE